MSKNKPKQKKPKPTKTEDAEVSQETEITFRNIHILTNLPMLSLRQQQQNQEFGTFRTKQHAYNSVK